MSSPCRTPCSTLVARRPPLISCVNRALQGSRIYVGHRRKGALLFVWQNPPKNSETFYWIIAENKLFVIKDSSQSSQTEAPMSWLFGLQTNSRLHEREVTPQRREGRLVSFRPLKASELTRGVWVTSFKSSFTSAVPTTDLISAIFFIHVIHSLWLFVLYFRLAGPYEMENKYYTRTKRQLHGCTCLK